MSNQLVIQNQFTLNGRVYQNKATISEEGLVSKIVPAPVAKTGTLTTRTSDSEGELTMAASHGITTGARLDLYWDGGSRRGITVGTVSVNQVPLTTATGAGDVLPADETAITASVPAEEEFLLTGNSLQALLFYGDQRAIVVLTGADDAEDFGREVGSDTEVGRTFLWYADDPNAPTNPVSGDTVAKAFISNGSSSTAAQVRVEALTT
jgi:hypothetical protein